jgi:alpha-mannosidase
MRLNAAGQIARLFDKACGREVFAEGQAGNRLQMFEDIPVEYEAWDIDEWYTGKSAEVKDLVSMEEVENGPVRTVVLLKWRARKSTIAQRMVLYGHTRRIDFETEVDWRERKTLLKAAFATTVRARRATYEIAFGAIDRSTQESNPWEWARFEVPAHKWADLSQADYGVSLLNDSKYGYDTHDNVMRISLLRSPEAPDPEGDLGRHEFTYSLLPHAGDWRRGLTVEEAFDLNVPLLVTAAGAHEAELPAEGWLLRLETPSGTPPVLTALKKAEDSEAVVVRFYEPYGGQQQVTLSTPLEVAAARRTNILEEPQSDLEEADGELEMTLEPFKIATVMLDLK